MLSTFKLNLVVQETRKEATYKSTDSSYNLICARQVKLIDHTDLLAVMHLHLLILHCQSWCIF